MLGVQGRVETGPRIQLAVHMDADGRRWLYSSGFRSSDQMAGPIASKLAQFGLPYSPAFVSIAVYSNSENPHDPRTPAFRALGPPVILKPFLLATIEIACAMDFQNAVSNRHDPRKVFRDLRNQPIEKIEECLLELIRMRPSYTWSEARKPSILLASEALEDRYKSDLILS
jgi:hypothetical protein